MSFADVLDDWSIPRPGAVDQFGPYRLIRPLALGSMSDVWLAEAANAGLVVVKRLSPQYTEDPQFLAFFLNEGMIARRLSHPNIVATIDFGYTDGQYFHAMEYVLGEPLERVLRRAAQRGRRLPIAFAVDVAAAVARALAHAHQCRDEWGRPLSIVHRDIAPHNILVGFDGTIKITDFGIAKFARQLHTSMPGSVKGHLGYLAPEQILGEDVDARTDMFSLGVILHELVAGRPLFRSDRDFETTRRILKGVIPLLTELRPDCPLELDRIEQRALARDPELRHQRAVDLLAELEGVRALMPVPPHIVATEMHDLFFDRIANELPSQYYQDYECIVPRRRRWLGAAWVALGAVVGALAVWMYGRLQPRADRPIAPVAAAILPQAAAPCLWSGGTPVVVATGQRFPLAADALAADEHGLYWLVEGGGRGALLRLPHESAHPVVLASFPGTPAGIALRYGEVVWSTDAQPPLAAISRTGGRLHELDGAGPMASLATDGSFLYFTDRREHGAVRKRPLLGGADIEVATEQAQPAGLALSGGRVVFANWGDGTIRSVSTSGGEVQILASGQDHPFGVAADEHHVYWTTEHGGTLMKIATDGGEPVTVAACQAQPTALAIYRHSVYWLNRGDGTVLRMER